MSQRRFDLLLLAVSLAAAALFFSQLNRLWPLVDVDITPPRPEIENAARAFLAEVGDPVDGFEAAVVLSVDEVALDGLERLVPREPLQALLRAGAPIVTHEVHFKRRDLPDRRWVAVHPAAGVVAWGRTVQEDEEGEILESEAARAAVELALSLRLGFETSAAGWTLAGTYERDRPARRDHYFVWERTLDVAPDVRDRLVAHLAGDRLVAVDRSLVLPESAARERRRREAPVAALATVGFVLAGLAGLGAFNVFLRHLSTGKARLAPAGLAVTVIGACYLLTQAQREAWLLLTWDPLWPRWIATLRALSEAAAGGAWILLLLFVVVAAGDALDRDGRGRSLWALGRGELLDPGVGRASLRGFQVGLLCGGTLTLVILLLELSVGAWAPLQPQGFFSYPLNARWPALATLLYFAMVALVEELAWRFFAGPWILAKTGRKWLAIAVPALLYGATHTGLRFLPPAEPFWGRAVALAAIGAVWGWAFFRFDALTCVLSHLTADLFVFGWPRLASHRPEVVATTCLVVLAPLAPGLLWLILGRRRSHSAPRHHG